MSGARDQGRRMNKKHRGPRGREGGNAGRCGAKLEAGRGQAGQDFVAFAGRPVMFLVVVVVYFWWGAGRAVGGGSIVRTDGGRMDTLLGMRTEVLVETQSWTGPKGARGGEISRTR